MSKTYLQEKLSAGDGIKIENNVISLNTTSKYGRYFYGIAQDTEGTETSTLTFPIYSTRGLLKVWMSPAGTLATNYTLAMFDKDNNSFNSTGWQGIGNLGWVESREMKDTETGLWWLCRWSAGGDSPLIFYVDIKLDYDNMIGYVKWMANSSKDVQDIYIEQVSDLTEGV